MIKLRTDQIDVLIFGLIGLTAVFIITVGVCLVNSYPNLIKQPSDIVSTKPLKTRIINTPEQNILGIQHIEIYKSDIDEFTSRVHQDLISLDGYVLNTSKYSITIIGPEQYIDSLVELSSHSVPPNLLDCCASDVAYKTWYDLDTSTYAEGPSTKVSIILNERHTNGTENIIIYGFLLLIVLCMLGMGVFVRDRSKSKAALVIN